MPAPLDLQEEGYAPTGGIGGEGVRRALGRPQMGILTLLAREALQNSWDARLSGDEPVQFMIHAWTLTKSVMHVARTLVFPELPQRLPLKKVLERDTVDVLCISDRGTRGLVGPTRADRLDVSEPDRNFVAFIRDVGRAENMQVDGGTYGYGKASLYQASRAGTICVHTRIKSDAGFEDRFIAAGLGDQHNATVDRKKIRRTGRCWWGRRNRDGVVDPVTGKEARQLATALGMPDFEGSQTGTSILVIAPDLSVDSDGELKERSLAQAVNRLVLDLVWFAWPKMIPERAGSPPPAKFQAAIRAGPRFRDVPFPDPASFPPVACFVNAYRIAVKSIKDRRTTEDCTAIKRYSDTVGWLALKKFGVRSRQLIDTGDAEDAAWVGLPSHHVALMRGGTRLIVKYVPGPPLPDDVVEYAGVFISEEHCEEAFAAAEPPTHDDWRPETLGDPTQKSQVRVALQKTKDATWRFAGALAASATGPGSTLPLGGFSERLGELLTSVPGTGRPDVPPLGGGGGGGGGGRVRRANVRPTGDVEYRMEGTRKAVAVSFLVSAAPGTRETPVRALARVAVGDGDQQENDPPAGADLPEVIHWLKPNGERLAAGTDLAQIPAFEEGVWKVVVSVPDDAMVMVNLRAE